MLLVLGELYVGECIWCNLLKLDVNVDLIYFIILWLLDKMDVVLVNEMLLIVFLM